MARGNIAAEIRDLAKNGAGVWFGNYDNAEDGVVAYDCAANRVRRSRALLNFHLCIVSQIAVAAATTTAPAPRPSREEKRLSHELTVGSNSSSPMSSSTHPHPGLPNGGSETSPRPRPRLRP